ncbi:hypothetical protein [Streptomyces sp. NBC_01235]|uniref:hypothetical protein n=1 Tax=Streptomyces sp. NBC_01235 TaxID=2903788 RepID=UPI002E11EA9E|nr:hypothetical protein OG289_04665 [Streptomyces sp. NBC_01235]
MTALVHDAVTTPSMHNAQPWHFRCLQRSRAFEAWADFERAMPHSDPDTCGLHLGCGAALLNLRAAIVHEGRHPEPGYCPTSPTEHSANGTAAATRSRRGRCPRPCGRLSARPRPAKERH